MMMKNILNKHKIIRYAIAMAVLTLMVGIAEYSGEKEIIFPEMAALTIGLWISNKRVWRIKDWQILVLMTVASIFGLLISLYSPLHLILNILLAFVIAGVIIVLSRSTLYPLISALILPVLLHTTSWIYPIAVFIMACILLIGKSIMQRTRILDKFEYEPSRYPLKSTVFVWLSMAVALLFMTALGYYTGVIYIIIPPLIVSFVEFVNAKAGFRNRPVLTVLLLFLGAVIGSIFQLVGYYYLHTPMVVVAVLILFTMFALFEWLGKFFAPAGAIAIIPLLIPQEYLLLLPLQVLAGATLFITIAMVFFQKCYKWSRAQIIYCLIPHYLISRTRSTFLRNNKKIINL